MTPHPDLAELGFLIGTWRGSGNGSYPTIEPFEYLEEANFAPLGPKPVIVYTQKTRHASTNEPLHSETGYLRPAGAGRIEMALAQPTGLVEILAGWVEGSHLHLRSMWVGRTPTAVEVSDVERHIEVDRLTMRYRLGMAAVGLELTTHLTATLIKVDDGPP